MKGWIIFLIFLGWASGAKAQVIDPDSSQKNYPPIPKINLDTVRTGKPDTSFNDSMKQPPMTQSKDSMVNRPGPKSNLRSPTGALLRSLAIPGWGQFYNRKYFKAVIVAGGEGTLLATAIVEWKRASDARKNLDLEDYRAHVNNRNMFLWLYAAATVVSMLDAYVDAHLSQDTGVGVPKVGELFLEPDAGKMALLLKVKVNF